MPDLDDLTPEQRQALMAQIQQRENAGLSKEQIEARNRQREIKKQTNLKEIEETLTIFKKGYYIKNNAKILINPKNADLSSAKVYLPDDIPSFTSSENPVVFYSCQNIDCLSLALNYPSDNVLVLNLASYTRPGGGTKEGANGQEEGLCRRTTLLQSLEDKDAKSFYDYNNSLKSRLGSNALIYSPNVAVFRDENGALLDKVQYIAVLSCAAPMIRFGLEGKTQQEYEDLLYCRLKGILTTAASLGYRHIILGAFGCGAYGNDAKIVSDIFKKALDEIHYFTNVDFAVLCKDESDYNFNEFKRNFG